MQTILLVERDGHEVYHHGLVLAPIGYDPAPAYRRAMEASEEWTYEDIISELKKDGVSVVENFTKFWEHEA